MSNLNSWHRGFIKVENENNEIKNWTPAAMLEVVLNEPDDFLKVRETLTRIGVASKKDQKLYQSCIYLSPSSI